MFNPFHRIYKKGTIEFASSHLRYEMSRVELGRDRLPRRMDIQSPGSTGQETSCGFFKPLKFNMEPENASSERVETSTLSMFEGCCARCSLESYGNCWFL